MTTIGPTLTTARLILRPPQHEDFDGFASMATEVETMRFIGGIAPRDAAWRGMASLAGSWALLGYGMFSVIRRDTNEWIGRLGPWRPGVKASAMGQGFAQEGAVAAIDWAFDHLGWDHVIHCIDKRNTPSIRLAERLGSQLETEDVQLAPPFEMHKVDLYGQSKAAWKARTRA